MKQLTKIFQGFFLALVFSLFLGVGSASAVGVSPAVVQYEGIAPGMTVEQRFTISRQDTNETTAFVVEPGEGLEGWVISSAGDKFILPAGKRRLPINLVFTVPQGTEPGQYEGIITIKTESNKIANAGEVGVNLGVAVRAIFNVTDAQVEKWSVKEVTVPAVEESNILRAYIQLKNEGNVAAQPAKVDVEIYDSAEVTSFEKFTIDTFEDSNVVDPFTTDSVRVDLPIRLDTGSYWAFVKVYDAKGGVLYDNKVRFKVVGVGELRKEGRLSNIVLSPRSASQNEQVKVSGNFKNTGSVQVQANLVVEFYNKQGDLVMVYEGDASTVGANEEKELGTVFSPSERGVFNAHVYVRYDDLSTAAQEFTYRIGVLNYPLIVSVILAIILITILYMLASKHDPKMMKKRK